MRFYHCFFFFHVLFCFLWHFIEFELQSVKFCCFSCVLLFNLLQVIVVSIGNSDFNLSKDQMLEALRSVAETIRNQKPSAKLYFMVMCCMRPLIYYAEDSKYLICSVKVIKIKEIGSWTLCRQMNVSPTDKEKTFWTFLLSCRNFFRPEEDRTNVVSW